MGISAWRWLNSPVCSRSLITCLQYALLLLTLFLNLIQLSYPQKLSSHLKPGGGERKANISLAQCKNDLDAMVTHDPNLPL